MEQQSGFYSDLLYLLSVAGAEDAYKILTFLTKPNATYEIKPYFLPPKKPGLVTLPSLYTPLSIKTLAWAVPPASMPVLRARLLASFAKKHN